MSRLIYLLKGKDELTPRDDDEPPSPPPGWVLGEFVSGTICSTDVTNLRGQLGHSFDEPKIIGHESCFRVLESNNPGVDRGDYLVPLGSDWFGFAEREIFFPIFPFTDPTDCKAEYAPRGYFDPPEQFKAVCVLKEWFSGASLIEPITHVYTALLRTGAFNARSMVVLGAGFCGQIACVLSKCFGVEKTCLIDINETRLKLAQENGFADMTLNPGSPDEILAIAKASEDSFADVLFDALPGILRAPAEGGSDTRYLGARLLRPGGTWVMYSASESSVTPSGYLLAKGITMLGAPYDHRLIVFPKRASQMRAILGFIRAGLIPVDKFIGYQIDFFEPKRVVEEIHNYGRGKEIKIELLGTEPLASIRK